MKIAVIDYGAGNIHSVVKAFRHLSAEVSLVQDAKDLDKTERLVLPGVGSFGHAAEKLSAHGLKSALREWIEARCPFLGICLGMQFLMEGSREQREAEGLAVLRGTCRKFKGKRVPQMGWNNLYIKHSAPLLHGITERDYFYFVHSYYVDPEEWTDVVACTEYEGRFASIINTKRAWGVQFHPEKSGEKGLMILRNWMERC